MFNYTEDIIYAISVYFLSFGSCQMEVDLFVAENRTD